MSLKTQWLSACKDMRFHFCLCLKFIILLFFSFLILRNSKPLIHKVYSLQYNALVLCKDKPSDFKDDKFTLKKYTGNPNDSEYREENENELNEDSLIKQSQIESNNPKLLVCITTYNEPPKQLVESLIGVYRAYYELLEMDVDNLNKVQVVIVFDGYENLSVDDLKIYEQAGIYNAFCTKDYKHAELRDDKTAYDIRFNGKFHNILVNKIIF